MTPSNTPGWEASAEAWIADQGEHGDFGRRYVLDPIMLPRALAGSPRNALDVGCGEGRFCRKLSENGVEATGIDPTHGLIAGARSKYAGGRYVLGRAEELPFDDQTFDLVVSYLSLIDIADFERAISEMARVLKPGGAMLIANLTSFSTAGAESGWVRDAFGRKLHYPIDHYLTPRAIPVSYRGIRIVNYHRPLSAYMKRLLGAGLELTHFDEPTPTDAAPEPKATSYRRAPHFLVMEWRRPLPSR